MDKSKYLIRYKCCFYDNDLVKHFKVYESATRDNIKKRINDMYGIPIDNYLEKEEVAPGVKYINKM